MYHKFNYRTELGGWVCTCQRYFDNSNELNAHIQIENNKLEKVNDKC